MPVEETVAVLGAGPSGLAVAACLRQRGVEAAVFERASAVGDTWRTRYERLHLHTVKQYSALPGMPWPEHVPTYPSRQDVVDYLEAYARRFDLAPRFGEEVSSVRRRADAWELQHTTGVTRARAVVVCTGYNRVPVTPQWPGLPEYRGELLHSARYRSGSAYRGHRALVIGAGNSGAEIALDLWESGARVALCVRGPLHVVPRDLMGFPAQVTSLRIMSKLPPRLADRLSLRMINRAIGDLSPWGIRRPELGPITQVIEHKRIPLIDVGTVALIKQGQIQVVPAIERFSAGSVHFVDGTELPVDLVIAATGYRSGLEDLLEDAAPYLDARGHPRVFGGEAAAPGLYFVGYRNPLTGQLHDIAREAARVAASITTRPA